MMNRHLASRASMAFLVLCAALSARSQTLGIECGSLTNHYGPFDYRTATNRDIVENVHFTQKVESLRGGNTSITAGGDINYTLRVYPNHLRALMAVVRLAEKEKHDPPRDVEFTTRCWFERAEAFRPDDAMVKAGYGTYLIRVGKPQDGAAKLEAALELAGDNANIQYNLGLAFFDLKEYDKALQSAHKAYALGFPLPGLRNKLVQAGKWRDPVPAAPPKDDATTSAAPSPK